MSKDEGGPGLASCLDITIVTAFFDIGRGRWTGKIRGREIPGWLTRNNETYLERFDFLARLKNNMVIFTEQRFADEILRRRAKYGLQQATQILTCDGLFDPGGAASPAVRAIKAAHGETFQAFVADPTCPEYWCETYVALNMLKAEFVSAATRAGLISDTQIAWIDFGYCRHANCFDPQKRWRFDCRGKINLFYIREPDERPIFDIVRCGDVYFQGCHIVGPRDLWGKLAELMDASLRSLLACGLVDDDQTALLMSYRQAPHLFQTHYVDPNDWFVIFRNFNSP